MSERRQLPPQIKRVELARRAGGRPVIRYQLTVDVGVIDGKRTQLRKRYPTEKEAREALDEIRGEVARGTYVHPSKTTVAVAIEDWLASKHGFKPSTRHGHRTSLQPVVSELGDIRVQRLTKRDIDDLVTALRAGGIIESPNGNARKPWSPRSVNYMLGLLQSVLDDQLKQGRVVRNVAALVDRIPGDAKPALTLTVHEVEKVVAHIGGDRYAIAWELALTGLRRGEIAGLRWEDVDLESETKTLTVARNRLRFGKTVSVGAPKSRASGRTLPLPERLAAAFRSARAIQAADKLALGSAYQASGYVVVNEAGEPLSPHALTSRWARMLKAAGVRHVRLHDARHTAGTMLHMQNVPVALIAAWLGHASKAFTLETYVHAEPNALSGVAQSFPQVVTSRDNSR